MSDSLRFLRIFHLTGIIFLEQPALTENLNLISLIFVEAFQSSFLILHS